MAGVKANDSTLHKVDFRHVDNGTLVWGNKSTKSRLHTILNPTQISITKTIPWQPKGASSSDQPALEFTQGKNRTLAIDILIDTYESGENVHSAYIKPLEVLTRIREQGSKEADKSRPPVVEFLWGGFQPFQGVIASLKVTYTMFFADGTPCRATVSVSMTETQTATGKAIAEKMASGLDKAALEKIGADIGIGGMMNLLK